MLAQQYSRIWTVQNLINSVSAVLLSKIGAGSVQKNCWKRCLKLIDAKPAALFRSQKRCGAYLDDVTAELTAALDPEI